MPTQTIVFAMVTFLHDLFTAIWIGGLITLGLTVMPSIKKMLGKGPETKKLMDTIQKRQSVLTYVSLVGLVLTGLLQANRASEFLGLFSLGNTYSAVLAVKHILVLAMIVIALYRSLVLSKATTHAQEKLKAALLILNIIFGVCILLLSGLATAISSSIPVI
jgi:uncharacterized membrane protein